MRQLTSSIGTRLFFAARLRALRFHLRGWGRYGGQVGAAGPIVWAVCLTCVIAGQEQTTVWSGVYTEAQAYRGEKVADTTCIGCHGPGLDGGDSGPKLVGEIFLANWSSQPVSELFAWIREAMPPEAAGTLSSEDTAAVVAYILKQNKMPAGKQALPSTREELSRIKMTSDKP